ncbi:putative phosphatase regulatory subunit-domain-containing protein [Stachybotrys elegans]|uniref:Phosphatase regulatory subunit-domain-containing protein n=1 Tax=Stachybotrys elegans TaxID=80388 RepID=A0A8K0T4A0_9HYPO|nr:putative phosphatase regulatory subunit-domain-containing protein [Stachybotrys elegans]
MPYTPPSHRSPASSASASPDASRRPSIQSGTTGRPSLPRSASYLNKHRRTPSLASSDGGVAAPLTPQGTSENLQALIGLISPSVRQSPPPVSNDRGMPKGAIISPPDSASSGSDDEGPEIRGRKLTNLKDLRDAVSQISQSQPREHSPTKDAGAANDEHVTPKPLVISFSTSALGDISKLGRRGHVRSSTEPNAPIIIQSAGNSVSTSEEDSDDDLRKKPQMVRKKSGELVRPALRPPSRRRPSSMPGTPVFSKAVHFDSHLEHVRHFLQVDRPLAVSAGSSPVEAYDSDTEYPFPNSDDRRSGVRSPPHEWEMLTPNFPHDAHSRSTLPVRLEKVWLSPDQKSLLGSVAVANLAFQKSVLCRFTLDYWKTTSEVAAEYSHEIRPKETPVSYDRFTFSIKLSDMANLETKTLFFCIRYAVNGQEYWDNNNHANFQVDFRKKYLPMNGKRGNQGAASRPLNGALPRSNRRQNAPAAPRPKSMPVAFDDFGDDSKFDFDQPIHAYLGESGSTGLRLKSRSSSNLASDNLTKDLSSPSGAAFANRYDFGASLSAAVQAAKDSMSREKDRDALYMKDHVRGSPATSSNKTATTTTTAAAAAVSAIPGTSSPIPGLPSSSYEELVNKYCFVGTPSLRSS